MEMDILDIIKTLGITGFALWIMWKMYEHSSSRFAEKDKQFIEEISRRETGMREIEKEVRTSIMLQLSQNTEAMRKVVEHINNHEKYNEKT